MTDRSTCLPDALKAQSDILSELALNDTEQGLIAPLVMELDLVDGSCDGKIPKLTDKELERVSTFIKDLWIDPQRKVAIQGALVNRFARDPFKELLTGSYKKIVQFVSQNPYVAHIILKETEPKQDWTPALGEKLGKCTSVDKVEDPSLFYQTYSAFVDELYEQSGIPILNNLIDEGEGQKNRDRTLGSLNPNVSALQVYVSKKNDSIVEIVNQATSGLDQLFRMDPSALDLLYEHKQKAEELFVETLKQKVGLFTDNIKDPFMYWIPLMSLLNSDVMQRVDRTTIHMSLALDLFNKVQSLAADEVERINFNIEFHEKARIPLPIKKYEEYSATVMAKIDELKKNQPPFYVDPKIQRYYAVWGRVWYYRYLTEVDNFHFDFEKVVQLEDEFRTMVKSRRDLASLDEVSVYVDDFDTIASVWAQGNGLIKYRYWNEGLDVARRDLERLATIAKEAESLANGWIYKEEGNKIKEVLADIRWQLNGESYISAGLSIRGLENIDSEQLFYRETESYAHNMDELAKKYPWLVKNNRITFEDVGEHGEEAHDISEAAFLVSKSMGREIGLPVVASIIGTGLTPEIPPLGAMLGGVIGKGANWIINRTDENVVEVLRNTSKTGIPIITIGEADDFKKQNNIDWLTCAVSAGFMAKFSRGALSFARGISQASLDFVQHGGISAVAKGAVKAIPRLPIKAVTGTWNGLVNLGKGCVNFFRVSLPKTISEGIPGAFKTENVVALYEKATPWARVKFALGSLYHGWSKVWSKVGIPSQVVGGGAMMAADYLPDKKMNTWYGALGASFWINVFYGKGIWGWDPNGGMAGFFWRYGFEVGVQWFQGKKVTEPDFAYTVAGMFSAYTARGINKVYSLGRAAVGESKKFLKRIAHFVENRDILVPQSVVGRSRIAGRWGLIRGVAIRIGKPIKRGKDYLKYLAGLSDGHILEAKVAEGVASQGKGLTPVKLLSKATGSDGSPIEVESIVHVPVGGRLKLWLSKTTHTRLGESWMYRLPNKIIRPLVKKFELRGLNDWWVKLGQKMSTPTKPIYNLRGSIANLEVVPLLGINGFALGLLQDADPVQMGLYRAGDYGTAYFFQHKIQHLLKIDSVVGTVTGYALGIPACIFGLPMIFPSLIHKAPGLSKEDTGYFASLAKDDFETANESLKTSISSYTFLHNVPVLGALWNKVSPLGSVEDSNWMIEDKGALAFWNQMLEKTDLAEKEVEVGFAEEGMPYPDNDSHAAVNTPVDTPNLKILSGFIKKVVEDDQKYFFEGGLPEDPATLRLHLLELALLKAIINNRNYPFIRNMAAEMARPIEPILQNIPLIASEEELRRFANNLNVNKIAGINNK